MLLLFFIVMNENDVANMDGVKELVDLTNKVLGEKSKYVTDDYGAGGYRIYKR